MNVLSVDYDYFITASAKARFLFPDGGAEFTGLDSFVWANAYASSKHYDEVLEKETAVDAKALEYIAEIIKKNCNMYNRAMIVDSHKFAYDFIKEYGDAVCNIYNIDFHHDCFISGGDHLHCGNWLLKLMQEGYTDRVYWIRKKESSAKGKPRNVSCISLSDLPEKFDLIFICRSGWWVPPHLDREFALKLAMPLLMQTEMPVLFQEGIGESRYTEGFKKDVIRFIKLRGQEQEKLL